jgi:CRISPR-associated endonuclease/helicase Cas3
MDVIITRHCVAQGEDRLSPLQRELIEHPARIRIAEAPTGAGKSYAFQRALRDQGQRILFIVPTRRLAQNLASGLVKDLIQDAGWSQAKAEGSVAMWSSEQTATLKAQGVISVNGVRLRQMSDLGSFDGGMIVAIPEVVSGLLVRRRVEAGQAGEGVFHLLEQFEHIVFDEFHSIEARGFGLAALFARLAAAQLDNRVGFGDARISFLSATPLDLKPTLVEIGVPEEEIALLHEQIVPDGRPLHGDVRLSLVDVPSLYDLILAHRKDIAAELAAGRQVVIVYNRLVDLEKDLPALARTLPEAGIDTSRVLVINSVRDSIAESLHQAGFAIGRQRDPLTYDLILATASVEMGVTFRNANFMLMEPGFEAMSFLQRYGRAARRGADGQVIVRIDESETRRKPWLRAVVDWAREQSGGRASIAELTQVLTQSVQGEFSRPTAAGTFGRLSSRAKWCTALYWSVLLEHPSNRGHRRRHLLAHQPSGTGALYRLEQEVRQLAEEPDLAEYVDRWLKLFHAQAFDLRTIEPKVRVVSDTGEAYDYPRVWLQRETEVLERGIETGDEIHLQGSIDDYWRDEKDHQAKRAWVCHFPHTAQVQTRPWDERLIDRWCRALEDIDPYGVDWEDHPRALEAAKKLVRLTGLVPGHDPEIPVDAVSGVL